MLVSMLYAIVRVLVDMVAVSTMDKAELEAEVLALRRQVQVLERQIKRVQWSPGDRMVLAALSRLLPKVSWSGLLVKPETVLGWHRGMVRRRWAAYRHRPRHGRPPLADEIQARSPGGGDHHPIDLDQRQGAAGGQAVGSELEAIPGSPR